MTDKENNFAKDINVPSKEQIIIDGKGCRYKTWDAECSLTGDHYGDNMKPCKFIDEKSCYFKQLARKTQECKQLKEDYAELEQECERLKSYGATLLADKNAMEIGRDDYMQRCKRLEQECEELKKELNGSEKWRIKAESLNEKLDIKNTRYRNALEEIEEYCNNVLSFTAVRTTESDILGIINEAKG